MTDDDWLVGGITAFAGATAYVIGVLLLAGEIRPDLETPMVGVRSLIGLATAMAGVGVTDDSMSRDEVFVKFAAVGAAGPLYAMLTYVDRGEWLSQFVWWSIMFALSVWIIGDLWISYLLANGLMAMEAEA